MDLVEPGGGRKAVREFHLPADGQLFCTVRVLDDGRFQVETDEGEWAMSREDSVIAAGLILHPGEDVP